ncbi:MAG: hypothetical protein JWO52_1214 [Gammaproteobacteria bacterium]|jgi:hypothetical protein|nr:hypothetical protein [Gammaproteobacteria bacterium]
MPFRTDTMQRASESRWFWIPGIFASLLYAALIIRWMPAAFSKAHEPFGVGSVIAGSLILAWKSFLRCAVAYVLTALALDWLPSISWGTALLISVAAVIGETLAEIITGQIVGVDAGVTIQLIVTAAMYCAVLVGSISIIRHRTRLQCAKPS